MTLRKRATLRYRDRSVVALGLFQVEPKVFRWVNESTGQPVTQKLADYLDESMAIAGLRAYVEGDPDAAGVDLTILPVSPPAEERAARRVMGAFDYGGLPGCPTLDELTEIIRNETALDKLVSSINDYLAYRWINLRRPKPPGLDVTEAGLMREVINALEKTQATDMSGLRNKLDEATGDVLIYRPGPERKQ